jgi:hypothetical protein
LEGATNAALIEEVKRRDDINLTAEFWEKMEPDQSQIDEFLDKHGGAPLDAETVEFDAVKSSVIIKELAHVIYGGCVFDTHLFRELIREYGIYS